MGDRSKRKQAAAEVKAAATQENGVDNAFDLWLTRGLHQLYDQVAKEPLPEELLRLIEEDRLRGRAKAADE